MDTGVPGHPGSHLLRSATWNRPLDDDTRRSLQGQRGASGARRFVVSMMQIDPTLLGVGDRACFVPDKRERRAGDGRLAEQRQHDRCEAQRPRLQLA